MVFCTGSFVSYSLALYLDQWILLHHWTKNDTKNIISDLPTDTKNIINDVPTDTRNTKRGMPTDTKNTISDVPTDTKNTISSIPTESPSSILDNKNVHLGLFYVQDPQLMEGKERVETNVYVQQYIQQHTIPVWVHMSRFIVVSAMIFQVYYRLRSFNLECRGRGRWQEKKNIFGM